MLVWFYMLSFASTAVSSITGAILLFSYMPDVVEFTILCIARSVYNRQ